MANCLISSVYGSIRRSDISTELVLLFASSDMCDALTQPPTTAFESSSLLGGILDLSTSFCRRDFVATKCHQQTIRAGVSKQVGCREGGYRPMPDRGLPPVWSSSPGSIPPDASVHAPSILECHLRLVESTNKGRCGTLVACFLDSVRGRKAS